MKKLLVLAAGLLQVPVIKKAKEMGIYVIAVDDDPNAPGMALADKAVVPGGLVDEEKVLAIAKEEHVDGVIHPCSEVAMNVMGRINDELHLSGISKEMAIRATNKHLMREAFEKYGAPSPKSLLTKDAEDAWRLFHEEFPTNAILKPSRNSGSRGIAKVEKGINKGKFEELYQRALEESRDQSVLIEQFIEGPEFSVEVIVWNSEPYVLAVTDKKTTEAPYFVELGHNQPSVYSEDIQQKLKDGAIAGIRALGLSNCAAHCELKVQDGKVYLMEIGARMGGDFISTELTHLSTGIDMVAATISVVLGMEPNLQPIEDKHGVCIRYFTPDPGEVEVVKEKELQDADHVYDAEIYVKPGDMVNEVKSSLDRSGHVIVTDKTPQLAVSEAETLVGGGILYQDPSAELTQKKLLMIGGGFLQNFVIRKAKSMGYHVLVVDGDDHAVGFDAADEYDVIDIKDEEACLKYAKEKQIDGVLTAATDFSVLVVSKIAEELNLPGCNYQTAKTIKNKASVRKCLFEAHADDTGYAFEIDNLEQIEDILPQIQFPVMVKPCDGSGSRGASKVEKKEDFKKACEYAMSDSVTHRAIAEPFVIGKEYGVESFVDHGEIHVLSVMQKDMTEPPYYAELGHAIPSGLDPELENKVKECVTKALKALGVNHGPVNMDLLITEGGEVHIVDIGARMGGNLIGSHIIPIGTGIDYMGNMIRAAIGDKTSWDPILQAEPVATKLLALTPGKVKRLPNMEKIAQEQNVIIEHHLHIGDTINEYHTNLDGCGYVVCKRTTVEEAIRDAKRAKETIDQLIERA